MKLNEKDVDCAVGFIATKNTIYSRYIRPVMRFVRGAIAYARTNRTMRKLISEASFDRNRRSANDIIKRHEFRTSPPPFMIAVPWGDDTLGSELGRLHIPFTWYADGGNGYFIFENETDYITAQLIK